MKVQSMVLPDWTKPHLVLQVSAFRQKRCGKIIMYIKSQFVLNMRATLLREHAN